MVRRTASLVPLCASWSTSPCKILIVRLTRLDKPWHGELLEETWLQN